jgi:hypothetical protein
MAAAELTTAHPVQACPSSKEEDELMKKLIPVCVLAASIGVPVLAQDSTTKTRTSVKADDAKTMMIRGCLMQNTATGIFTLNRASAISGDDLKAKSTVKTDIDKDDAKVTDKTTAKIDDADKSVGTSGVVGVYELTGRDGVNLMSHVGHEVEIAAVMVEAGKGDADVKIKEDAKTKVDDAPDSREKSTTKVDIDKGATPRLAVVSISEVGSTCQP